MVFRVRCGSFYAGSSVRLIYLEFALVAVQCNVVFFGLWVIVAPVVLFVICAGYICYSAWCNF